MNRFVRPMLIAAIWAAFVFGVTMFLFRPYPRYYAVAYREYDSPTADDGFKGLGKGVSAEQTFYWDELTGSKEFALEVLRQMGKGPDSPYVLHSLVPEKFLEAERRRSPHGLFLILNYTYIDSAEDLELTRSEALEEFAAFEAAFVKLAEERGASLTGVLPVF